MHHQDSQLIPMNIQVAFLSGAQEELVVDFP